MEAAASGLPIVATDVRGCRQVVDDGTTGLLVPVADAAALRTAISALAASPERRRAMGAAARAKAEREFDERDVVRRVMDAYAWAADAAGHQARVTSRIHATVAASPSSQRDRHDVREQRAQAGAVGLGVRHVAGPRRTVLAFERVADHLLEELDEGQQVGARAEREVHRLGVGDPADHGVGDHRGDGVDEREVPRLRAVAVDRQRPAGEGGVDERRHDGGVGVARGLTRARRR